MGGDLRTSSTRDNGQTLLPAVAEDVEVQLLGPLSFPSRQELPFTGFNLSYLLHQNSYINRTRAPYGRLSKLTLDLWPWD
jgi:hypothetical protein